MTSKNVHKLLLQTVKLSTLVVHQLQVENLKNKSAKYTRTLKNEIKNLSEAALKHREQNNCT